MARYMDIAYAQGDTIIKVDISNALNTVRHRPIFDGIVAMVPGIARYFRFQYGNRSIMRNNEGEINAYTRTGLDKVTLVVPCTLRSDYIQHYFV